MLLLIGEAAKRIVADLTPHARFLFRLLCGGGMRGHAVIDITLGNDPAPGLTGGHQHNLDRRAGLLADAPIGQGTNLANIVLATPG